MTSVPARVWAPIAKDRVELCLRGRRVPLRADHAAAGGSRRDPALADGTDYAFSIDGGEPRPDPRSPWQPDGVARLVALGRPRAVRLARRRLSAARLGVGRPLRAARRHVHDRQARSTRRSSASTISCELGRQPRRADAGRRVPRCARMGIRRRRPVSRRRAATADRTVCKRFVAAAHDRGLAVLLDVVYNHFGPDGNYLGASGRTCPTGTRRSGVRPSTLTDRAATRCDASSSTTPSQWLRDYHFDGLRLDAVHAFLDTSAVHFLEQLSAEVDQLEAALGAPDDAHRGERPGRSARRATARAGTVTAWMRSGTTSSTMHCTSS